MSFTCQILFDNEQVAVERTFLVVPRAGEAINIPAEDGGQATEAFYVQRVIHFPQNAPGDTLSAAVQIHVSHRPYKAGVGEQL